MKDPLFRTLVQPLHEKQPAKGIIAFAIDYEGRMAVHSEWLPDDSQAENNLAEFIRDWIGQQTNLTQGANDGD